MDTDHQPQTKAERPQHTEHGYGTYEWDPQRGVVFRMDLDQFGTVGGVQLSQYTPPRGTNITVPPLDGEASAPLVAPTPSGRMTL